MSAAEVEALAPADGVDEPSPGSSRETKTKEPKYSKITQQELPAWRPVLTPRKVITLFFLIGLICMPLGAAILAATSGVVETSQRYDHICTGADSASWDNEEREAALKAANGTGLPCTVTVTVPEKMKAPVYLYYGLDNFFQNHRRYVKSRSDAQLRGDSSSSGLSDCDPQDYVEGEGDEDSRVINPCGLIAWSFFNDTFSVSFAGTGAPLPVREHGIAWESDIDRKFDDYIPQNFNTDPEYRGGGAIDGTPKTDEHFIVWMRTAALSSFRKLWGVIDEDIPAGTELQIAIQNRYNTYRFDGKKHVVLSTSSWAGGKNPFLGIAYLCVGGIAFGCSLFFIIMHLVQPRAMGNPDMLSWNQEGGK